MSGHNGKKCQSLAFQTYQDFLEWYRKNMKDCYLPKTGVVKMYSQKSLTSVAEVYNNAKENSGMKFEDKLKLFSDKLEKPKMVNIRNLNTSRYDFSDIVLSRNYVLTGTIIGAIVGGLISWYYL